MIVCEILLLCSAVMLCIQSMWTDLRYGQVKNQNLVIWLTVSVLLNGIYYGIYCRDCLQIAV